MSAFDQIRDVYFGGARMPLSLDSQERRRIMWVSVAPAVIVAAVIVSTVLNLAYGTGQLYFPSNMGGAPSFWKHVDAVTDGLLGMQFAALALLFAAGLQNWTRAEGSWMLFLGTVLGCVALVLALFVVGAFALFSRAEAQDDVKVFLWQRMAGSFGVMAIGYFFLAYRGASAPPETDEPQPHA